MKNSARRCVAGELANVTEADEDGAGPMSGVLEVVKRRREVLAHDAVKARSAAAEALSTAQALASRIKTCDDAHGAALLFRHAADMLRAAEDAEGRLARYR